MLKIGSYEDQPAAYHDLDPRAADVAALLREAIREQDSRIDVDHIGSTAVPGCHGKGVIDLAVTYVDGDLERAKAALDALGFLRQRGRDPFPESRPMRIGAVEALGGVFRVHAHVILRDGDEHRRLLWFRDALRHDDQLRAEYERIKRGILDRGITDSLDYCYAKEEFIARVLEGRAQSN